MEPITNRYRSGLERKAAAQLEGAFVPFGYESEVIRFVQPAKDRRYNPDFVLTKKDGSKLYLELKGKFETDDRQKHLMIKEQHPDLDIRIVFQRASNRIGKTSKTTYAKWCETKGIPYADHGQIPRQWLLECA